MLVALNLGNIQAFLFGLDDAGELSLEFLASNDKALDLTQADLGSWVALRDLSSN